MIMRKTEGEENAMAGRNDEENRATTRARAVDDKDKAEEGQSADGIASGDQETADKVAHDTTTRERQARSKRAHEPLDWEEAAEEQPAEDDNGPRLPEVAGAEAAKVADPGQSTESADGPTGDTVKVDVK